MSLRCSHKPSFRYNSLTLSKLFQLLEFTRVEDFCLLLDLVVLDNPLLELFSGWQLLENLGGRTHSVQPRKDFDRGHLLKQLYMP